MFRVPLFLVVLSVALMAAGGFPSPFGYISSGFRSLADYKMATTSKLASYFTGERYGKEMVVVKDGAVDPDEGGAEHAAAEQPDSSVEVVQQAAAVQPPSNPQELPVDGPASTDPVHDFKKQFGAGYAALDFANQLEKSRLAAGSSATMKPQQFDAQVLPVPLDHYKDYVTGGHTGGSLMRVAVVAQNVPKSFYSSQPTGDSPQPWNQQGASEVHPEQPMEHQPHSPAHLEQPMEQQQQHQPQNQDSRTEPASQSYSGEQHQGHIYPYAGWQTGQHSGYVAYPHSSYHVATASGSDSAPAHTTGADHVPHYGKHHDGVVSGSPFPQHSEGTPDAEPVPETAEATPASHVMESDGPDNDQGPRYRREADVDTDEVFYARGHPPVPEADRDMRGHELGTDPFKKLGVLDMAECMAKLFCTMAARPTTFGPQSVNMTEYLRDVEKVFGNTNMDFWKQASAAGGAKEDCEALFTRCIIHAENLKYVIDRTIGHTPLPLSIVK